MLTSIYVHIPFCDHICTYCDFHKEIASDKKKQDYIDALCRELVVHQDDLVDIKTIYIGGGTPLSLDETLLAKLLETISQVVDTSRLVEYTIETNPNNLTASKIALLQHHGVNRVSIGVQTFQSAQLSFLNRDHKLADVTNGIQLLRDAEFPTISVDMIFSLIGQTMAELDDDLDKVIALGVDHISYYSLILEEKTILFHMYRKNEIEPNDEDLEGAMYERVIDTLQANGYDQYEISNFARNGAESEHNKTYWLNRDYRGFGSGAHSLMDGKRFYHEPNVRRYIQRAASDDFQPTSVEVTDGLADALMLGLRLTNGVSVTELNQRYDTDLFARYPELNNHINNGLIIHDNDRLFLSRSGILLGNIVFQTFVEVT